MKLKNIFKLKSWKGRLLCFFETFKIKKLINKKYKDYYIFTTLFSYGDVVATACLMEAFSKLKYGKILFLINKEINDFILKFEKINSTVIVSNHYMLKCTEKYKKNTSFTKGEILPIFIHPLNTKYNPINMVDFHRYLLGLPKDIQPTKIKLDNNLILNIRNKYNIKPNTVLLSPEANSLNYKILYPYFWIKLADLLISKGYNIIFNSKNNSFKKYQCIFDSILNTVAIAENCKCIIGFRSGLMDVFALSVSKKMFAIYPSDKFQICTFMKNIDYKNDILQKFKRYKDFSLNETVIKFSSLKEMYNNNNITETIFTGDEQLLINDIFNFI